MKLSASLTTILWLAPVLVQPVIACVMVSRRLVGLFPIFFCFNILVPARDIALFFLTYHTDPYALVYWWGEGVAVLLALGVVFEATWHFVRSYPTLRILIKILCVAGVIAFVLAFAMMIGVHGPRGADLVLEWIIMLERSARFLQVCLLIVAIGLMSRLGLTWHHYALGIAAGFGVYSALDLVLLELRAHLHVVTDAGFVLLRPAAYNLGVAIWVVYFLWPQGKKSVERLPQTDIIEWNDALTPHLHKWYRR